MSEHELIKLGRLPMTDSEAVAVEALIARYGDQAVGITRSGPRNTGTLLVTIGAIIYEVNGSIIGGPK